MGKKNKMFLLTVIAIAFASPYLLRIAILKKIVCSWLNNPVSVSLLSGDRKPQIRF